MEVPGARKGKKGEFELTISAAVRTPCTYPGRSSRNDVCLGPRSLFKPRQTREPRISGRHTAKNKNKRRLN
ncbi:hypothetical protein NDU88_011019 [Pleurodeles waltl]|uniref:Uncharacterized protein n=1 Tax=Pleurodeles waltl TaxID=8319 RepID=A0AAV7S5Q8_PLEWA|nr:hypothetical protein NDU88_011019 [Pleurodeles waltl]